MSSSPPATDLAATDPYEVPDIPSEYQQQWERHQKKRDRLRSELRVRMWYRLYQLTGVFDPFGMRWTNSLFLSVIVGKYGCGMEGWPPDIPFQNLGYIGQAAPLEKLLGLWMDGTLRIVKLTDGELARAAENPESVLPNTTLPPPPRPRPETPERVVPLVLHPVDLHELSQPSAASTSSSTPLVLTTTTRPPKRKRKQRCDTKLARTRHRHYGGGVKSREYVYDEESGGEPEPDPKRFREALSDDIVEEFPIEEIAEAEAKTVEDEIEDEIEQFTESEADEVDDIESATESWMLGEESDSVGAESDVE